MHESEAAPPPAAPEAGPTPRSVWRRLVARAFVILKIGIVTGLILHLTIRDAVPGLAVLYYMLPRIVLAALALLAGIGTVASRKRSRSAVWFVIAIVLIVWWHRAEWRAGTESAERGLKVMYWNTGRGLGGWDAITHEIEAKQPDLVALGETAHPSDEFREFWRKRFPQYDVSFLGGGMICMVRGSSSDARVPKIDGYTQVREIDATIDGTELRCLIVDVYAFPLYDRRAALTAIAQIAEQSADRPVIILGDFNTPLGSVHLAELRRKHVNAFESAGRGCAATWPAFAPVLSLDQIWANSNVNLLDCHPESTSASDHRPLLATMRAAAGNPAMTDSGN